MLILLLYPARRAPHGARGLKYHAAKAGADLSGRAPHGARGLKFCHADPPVIPGGRAPHGARGLKFPGDVQGANHGKSRPAWGAWIEMA